MHAACTLQVRPARTRGREGAGAACTRPARPRPVRRGSAGLSLSNGKVLLGCLQSQKEELEMQEQAVAASKAAKDATAGALALAQKQASDLQGAQGTHAPLTWHRSPPFVCRGDGGPGHTGGMMLR